MSKPRLKQLAQDGANDGQVVSWSAANSRWQPGDAGDVVGPASATDNAIARFDGTTGKVIQNSGPTISDAGYMGVDQAPPINAALKCTSIAHHYAFVGVGGTLQFDNLNVGIMAILEFVAASGNWSITGLASVENGKMIYIINRSGYTMTLVHESGSSTAANRLSLALSQNIAIPDKSGVILTYSALAARWQILDGTSVSLTSTAPANVTKAAAAVGTATDAARRDHKHDVTTAAAGAAAPGDTTAEGTATSLARSDHRHSLPSFGTGVGTFCQGNDSRLSDARTPTSHATSHKSGGGDSIKLDELAAPTDVTTLNATTGQHGLLPKLGGGTTNFLRADGAWSAPPGGGTTYKEYLFQADQMESPNSADWAVNALAPLTPGPSNAGLNVRQFDDTTAEGVGFTVKVPTGATNIIFDFLSRKATAPGTAQSVALNLYEREIPDNAAVTSWSSAFALTNVAMPANAYYQEDTQTITLATLGLTAGRMHQFELTRNATAGGDTLTGDWCLHSVRVRFS